jgi:2-phospho-L-lactate guanylyltransferase
VAAESSPGEGLGRCVLVPIKSFAAAKGRLREVLGEVERRALVTTMARRVLAAAAPLPVYVACDDHDVAAFADAAGATVAWTPGLGLNGAVAATIAHLAGLGATYVTVVHADLPFAHGIGELEHHEGVTIAPDRHHRGTNLLRVPVGAGFAPHFGRDSLRRHQLECEHRGLPCTIVDRDDLAFDVDLPSDLEVLQTRRGGTP